MSWFFNKNWFFQEILMSYGCHFVFHVLVREMSSYTVSDIRSIVWRQISFTASRLEFYWYGLSDLDSRDRFWNFLQGCQEDDGPHKFCPGCYVFGNGVVCTIVFLVTVSQILVLVLLPKLVNCFNGCVEWWLWKQPSFSAFKSYIKSNN
jgi:hypothetical protein